MQFELPGQLKGPECRRVISQAIALRRRLEPFFRGIGSTGIDKFTIVLRIDGTLGSFGQSGVENIHTDSKNVSCDLLIEDLGWDNLSDDEIYLVLTERVAKTASLCLQQSDLTVPVGEILAASNNPG